jgi:hypothetical protein
VKNSRSGSKATSNAEPVDEDAQAAFEKYVHSLVSTHCAECHGRTQSPQFAVADVAAAFQAFSSGNVINATTPAKSRVVERLSVDQHNCWSDCQANGDELAAAITQYQKAVNPDGEGGATEIPGIKTSEVAIPATVSKGAYSTLTFDLKDLLQGHVVSIELQVKLQDAKSYQFKAPKLTTDASVQVKNLRILINDHFDPSIPTFSYIEELIAPPGKLLHAGYQLVGVDKGAAEDKIKLVFEVLELR